jgi:hypothetical protein
MTERVGPTCALAHALADIPTNHCGMHPLQVQFLTSIRLLKTTLALFVSRLVRELDVRLDDHRIRIECDNKQTIRLITAEVATLRTKLQHVDIHNHWLRQEFRRGTIDVAYTKSAEMMADGLTKALYGDAFQRFREQMGLENVVEQQGLDQRK